MAHLDNRSRTQVKVKNRDDLTRFFPHNKLAATQRYISELRAVGFKPTATVLDEAYLVRYTHNGKRRSFTAKSESEAIATLQRIESEQHHGLRGLSYGQVSDLSKKRLLFTRNIRRESSY